MNGEERLLSINAGKTLAPNPVQHGDRVAAIAYFHFAK
jgi:hypothetical protein